MTDFYYFNFELLDLFNRRRKELKRKLVNQENQKNNYRDDIGCFRLSFINFSVN